MQGYPTSSSWPLGAIDSAMDFFVAPGYTSPGYWVRSRSWNDDLTPGELQGRTVLVTGASSGIGEATSRRLAELGARVHVLGRNTERAADAHERISAQLERSGVDAADRIVPEACDLSDLDAVESFAARFATAVPRLHGLVHNAGILPSRRARTAQGHELAFATNVLAPFLLTNRLLGRLRAGSPSRAVLVSSAGMYTARLALDDLELDRREFDGARFYAHTKRIEVILGSLWAERELGTGVSFASMHPGWVDTPGLRASLPRFHRLLRPLLRQPTEGADTAVWLIARGGAEAHPGAFWHDRRPRPEHRLPWTRESESERHELWTRLERMTAAGPEREQEGH